jgi:hypothetical protein
MARSPAIAWHYTTGLKAQHIFNDARLKLETGPVSSGERPALWFTASDAFEPTAFQAIQRPDGTTHEITTVAEQAAVGQGLVRIAVRTNRLHPYSAWVEKSGVHPLMQMGMELAAGKAGSNTADWWVSFKTIKAEAWERIEVSADGSTWSELDLFSEEMN